MFDEYFLSEQRYLDFLEIEQRCFDVISELEGEKELKYDIDLETGVVSRFQQEMNYGVENLYYFSSELKMDSRNNDKTNLRLNQKRTPVGEDLDRNDPKIVINNKTFKQIIAEGVLESKYSSNWFRIEDIDELNKRNYKLRLCERHAQYGYEDGITGFFICSCGKSRYEMWCDVVTYLNDEGVYIEIQREKDDFVGMRDYNIVLPSMPDQGNDGQFKIATDFVLTVADAIREGDNKEWKILVIGSSSPDGVASGKAYDILPALVKRARVTLVDPYEIPLNYKIGGVIYMGEQRMYNYSELGDDVKKYDIILNDAWVQSQYYSVDWDKDGVIMQVKNYSIKNFDFEEKVYGNCYRQRFVTKGERRAVSRNIRRIGYWDSKELGRCPGCSELRYRCPIRLSDEVCRIFMRMHARDCRDKRKEEVVVKEIEWVEIERIKREDYDKYSTFDFDRIDGCQLIPRNFRAMFDCKVMLSTKIAPNFVFTEAKQVVVQMKNRTYTNIVFPENKVRESKEVLIRSKGKLNSSHDAVTKRKRLILSRKKKIIN